MLYKHKIENCLIKNIVADYNQLLEQSDNVLMKIKQQELFLLELPKQTDDLKEILALAEQIKEQFEQVIVLGTGGSSLNGQALGNLTNFTSSKIKLNFLDNIDPHTIDQLFTSLNLEQTAFLVISKSGKTAETIAQTLIAINYFKQQLGNNYNLGKHFFFISDPVANPLREIAKALGATMLDHLPVGGRFSTFTNVGLLPAAILDLCPYKIREGAASLLENLFSHNDALTVTNGAALNMAFFKNGYNINVIMPYIDRLSSFATWYCQIWGESLGKNGIGSTPVKAIGTLDQHSQLQLYLDGPKDKLFTLITLNTAGQGAKIENNYTNNPELKFMLDKTIGDLMQAEQQATINSLTEKGCPVRVFELKILNEQTFGALAMHFIMETIIFAQLANINPFDQPAVEQGKIYTRQILEENYIKGLITSKLAI